MQMAISDQSVRRGERDTPTEENVEVISTLWPNLFLHYALRIVECTAETLSE